LNTVGLEVFLLFFVIFGATLSTLMFRRGFAEEQCRRYGHWHYTWFWVDLVGAERSTDNWVRLCRVAACLALLVTLAAGVVLIRLITM
jgi:hypothetical protein